MEPTVFIIDDDDAMRKSIGRLLRAEEIRSESFSSARDYLARERYDGVGCILLDINMPDISGIELQAQLVDTGAELPIIFLTGYGNVPTSVEAMKRGAIDFLTKPVDEADLLPVISQALDLHRSIREAALIRESIRKRLNSLTLRENEVMLELITGVPNKIVADRLKIAVKTVKVHRAHLLHKMEVRSVAELVHLCHLVGKEPGSEATP